MREAKWLAALIFDYSLIGIALGAVHLSWWAAPFALVAIGARQQAIIILGHEGAHGNISNVRWLNDWAASVLCLWPFGFGLSGYRRFHLAHHRHLNTPLDPELTLKAGQGARYRHPYRARWIMAALIGDSLQEVAQIIAYVDRRSRWWDLAGPTAVWPVFIWATGAWWIAGWWFLAMGTVLGAASRLRIWTEHTEDGTPQKPVPWLWRVTFLPHNIGLHHEHHARPWLPFWQLG